MKTQINLSTDVELIIHDKLSKQEKESLIKDLKKDFKTYIEMRLSDLWVKHPKLLKEYELNIETFDNI